VSYDLVREERGQVTTTSGALIYYDDAVYQIEGGNVAVVVVHVQMLNSHCWRRRNIRAEN